ncbi:MAG: hypothetical protein ABR596_11015 [Halarsenatibacteraceae bacterium]
MMVKLSTLISIIIIAVIIVGAGPGAQALELDVEDAMSRFASEVRLLDEELRILRNPFADYRPEEETAAQSRTTSSSASAAETGEDQEEEPEEIEPPSFRINGSARSGNRVVLIIENGEVPELLRSGQSFNGYQFTGFENGEAIFTQDGQEFNLQVGGGA